MFLIKARGFESLSQRGNNFNNFNVSFHSRRVFIDTFLLVILHCKKISKNIIRGTIFYISEYDQI